MKIKAVLLCTMFMLVTAGASYAAGECWYGPTVGLGLPMGDFKDVASPNVAFGGVGTYMVNDQFGIGLDAGYHMWKGSDLLNAGLSGLFTIVNGSPVVAEAKWSAIQATLHGQINIPMEGSVKPYLRFGAGLYNVKLKITTDVLGDNDTSKSKVGLNGGVGANIMANDKMAVGITGLYHYVPTKDDFGGNISSITVQASLLFKAGGK